MPRVSKGSKQKPVKVFAVTAGKGGVGKTHIAVNLAIALAQKNNKVLLLDADLGLGNVDIMLGLKSKHNLANVIQGDCSLSDIILRGPSGIQLIPAATGIDFMAELTPTEHAGIIDAFNELTDDLDYMIIDTAAGISDTVLSFTRSSQELILIVCDEPASIADAYALMKVMSNRFDWSHFHILANMVRKLRDGRLLFNKLFTMSEQFLDVQLDYLGAIPFDEHVYSALRNQKAVLTEFPEAPAAHMLREVADKIEHWNFNTKLGGNTSFFLERLVTGAGQS